MTTATENVQESYREGNLIAVGQAVSTAQITEGLAKLNNLLKSAFGFLLGESLTDWQVPAVQRSGSVAANPPMYPGSQGGLVTFNNAYPAPNSRLVWDGSAQTIYFPETPHDGARMAFVKSSGAAASGSGTLTLNGNGRTIEGANTYTSDGTTVTSRAWMYRADTANWVALVTLTADDDLPFPEEFDDLWSCGVAIRLSPRYGKQVGEGTVATYRRLLTTLKARYRQPTPQPSGGSVLVPADQTYPQGKEWME